MNSQKARLTDNTLAATLSECCQHDSRLHAEMQNETKSKRNGLYLFSLPTDRQINLINVDAKPAKQRQQQRQYTAIKVTPVAAAAATVKSNVENK